MHPGWLIATLLVVANPTLHDRSEWGFYGHKLINRMAVFTLPEELIGFYKLRIDVIEANAVNADKRRYAAKREAIRHYIDLDQLGSHSIDELKKPFSQVFLDMAMMHCLNARGDTMLSLSTTDLSRHARMVILNTYYQERDMVDCDSTIYFPEVLQCDTCYEVVVEDNFTTHGILPYHLSIAKRQLTKAFSDGDIDRVVRISSDIGHYIADAHVPLHTTSNYNGQLTGQTGLHAFWESRIPELMASEYDFLVGRSTYITNTDSLFWNVVLASHALVEEVLSKEESLSASTTDDRKYCFTDKGTNRVSMECPAYVRAYSGLLDGMVEQRMRSAVHTIGSVWYTCWVDAGRPSLDGIQKFDEALIQTDTVQATCLRQR